MRRNAGVIDRQMAWLQEDAFNDIDDVEEF
jgi:hypothetical protein